MSEAVRVVELVRHIDDRGYLYEIIHSTDDFLRKFGQTYVVCSPVRGTIRGFHKHNILWDYFCVVKGSAQFILADVPDDVVTAAGQKGETCVPRALESFVLSDLKPSLLVVPAGVWHGWMSLQDDTVVVST